MDEFVTNFEKQLLNSAYQNYLKFNDEECRFVPNNSNAIISTINSLSSLRSSGYVEVLSDNIDKTTLHLFTPDMIFVYRLTDKGMDLVRSWS